MLCKMIYISLSFCHSFKPLTANATYMWSHNFRMPQVWFETINHKSWPRARRFHFRSKMTIFDFSGTFPLRNSIGWDVSTPHKFIREW